MLARQPLVSIIMPVYNNGPYLECAINSVRAQSYSAWELIIVDDASTDETPEILRRAAQLDSRITISHRHTNSGGAARPRNEALEQANGRYIAFIDGDDMWQPDKLERQLAFMQEKRAAISHTAYRLITPDGMLTDRLYHPAPITDQFSHLQRRNMGMQVMIDRAIVGDFRFDENAPVEDFDLFVRLLKDHKAHGLDEELYLYRRGHRTLSSGRLRMMFNVLRSTAYTRRELGVVGAAKAFIRYSGGFLRRRVNLPLP